MGNQNSYQYQYQYPFVGLLDSLYCVAWFDIKWRNNYGNGEQFLSGYGPVLTQSSWNIVEGGKEYE